MSQLDQDIRIMLAKEAIRTLAQEYCRGCDRGDIALLRALYVGGALDDHGFNATGTAEEFFNLIPLTQTNMRMMQHHITNHLVSVNGDEAEGEAYVVGYLEFQNESGPQAMAAGSRYLDRYVQRSGVWKIAHRRCVPDWSRNLPPSDGSQDFTQGLMPGRIGADDPSYDFLTLFRRGERSY